MRLPPTTIWYHGTSDAETAKMILAEGFAPRTYFGKELNDALIYGGSHIFEVAFPSDWTSESGWQMVVPEFVPTTQIVAYYVLEKTPVYENEGLREDIFVSNTSALSRLRSAPNGWKGPPRW